MTDKQPTFADRVKAMQVAANNLVATSNMLAAIARDVQSEADQMATVQKRYSERRADEQKADR